MQVIAPDFTAPIGARSSAREEERSGNGTFDTLLREENSRYERAPEETREPARPARDDAPRETPPREEPLRDSAIRDKRPEPEQPPAAETVAADDAGDDTPVQEDSKPVEAEGDSPAAATAATQTAPAAAVAQKAVATPDAAGSAAAGDSTGKAAASAPDATQPAPEPAAAAPKPAGQQAAAETSAPTQQPPTATAPEAGDTPPATSTPSKPPASGALPAQQAADRASVQATSKDPNAIAVEHRQSPAAAQGPVGSLPAAAAARASQASGKPQVTASGSTGLDSRPTAALGGGAASVAMAQHETVPAKSTAATAATSSTAGEQKMAATPAASPNQAVTAGATLATAMASGDKSGGGTATTAPAGGGDAAGQPAGQSNSLGGLPGVPGSGGGVQQSSFAESLATARHSATANPAEQIAVQVQRAQVAGQDQISIKLHPAELGRIEVKLENASDGTLRAVISAERSETLDLLQRDARGLERALQDAGVKTDSGSLNFNLRGQSQEQQNAHGGGTGRDVAGASRSGDQVAEATETAPAYRSSHNGALDIRV